LTAEDRAAIIALLTKRRWAALATRDDAGDPLASQVGFAVAPNGAGLLLHLSRLAAHTRNLAMHPRVSLVISQGDDGRADPQTLARLSMTADARLIDREDGFHERAHGCYVARLPEAEMRFTFTDFDLYLLAPRGARFVGGFARACSLRASSLRGLLSEIAELPVCARVTPARGAGELVRDR